MSPSQREKRHSAHPITLPATDLQVLTNKPSENCGERLKTMALITTGPAVGQISGSISGQTFSRNRYGAYIRSRTKPVVSTSAQALLAKARLGNVSAQWSVLSAAARASWATWAAEHPVVNRLGQSIILTGHAAYVQLNTRLDRAGDSWITAPPISAAPTPLLTASLTGDIGAGTTLLSFTATPLGADDRIWMTAALVDSAGINYIKNVTKLVSVTAKAQVTDYDYQADVEARFGTMIVGQKLIVFVGVFDSATGLLSTPLRAEVTVVTT